MDQVDTGVCRLNFGLELLRQSGEAKTLRLFIDLYHAQSLALDGGIHFRRIRQEYKRMLVGRSGPYIKCVFAALMRKPVRSITFSSFLPGSH